MEDLNPTKTPENSLRFRRGSIKLSGDYLERGSLEEIKVIFSIFYPKWITPCYETARGDFNYYGYSEHFREIEDAVKAPEYMIWFKTLTDGSIIFDKVEEVINKF
jgi:hypothetical protein